jgi:PEP-CTERM motif
MNKLSIKGFAAAFAVVFGTQAQAGIAASNVSVSACSSTTVSQAIPVSVGTSATNNNCVVNVFAEGQNIALTSAIQHDLVDSNLGSGIKTTSGSTLAAGTLVNSYLINFQPSAISGRIATGSVTFTEQILAVVYSNGGLFGGSANRGFTNTSYLQGTPSYTYGQVFGLETILADSFMENGNTINFTMVATSLTGSDNLRVITAVPTPSSIALLGLGAFGLVAARRKAISI